jgi:hypothetical protein
MPESTISPSQGLRTWPQGLEEGVNDEKEVLKPDWLLRLIPPRILVDCEKRGGGGETGR